MTDREQNSQSVVFIYLCIMIRRQLEALVCEKAQKFPVLAITGPRQSGKTTLIKSCFPQYRYYNLEAPDTLAMIQSDPRTFLSGQQGLILDEVQKAPELFSYIQVIADEEKSKGKFILSGSQNFLLQERISQTLAGRIYNAKLLPFDNQELSENNLLSSYSKQIFTGFYPRVIADGIEPSDYYPQYIQTYVERDVRDLLRIGNLSLFQRFIRVLAGRAGNLLNLTEIGTELGIDHKTVRSWISLLESSYIVFLLQPFEKNYNKRILKTPKLYFYDTGLLSNLLGIQKESQLEVHWAKGALFENLVIANLQKQFLHNGKSIMLYYWRNQSGNELDCIYEDNGTLNALEIKSSTTFSTDFLKGLTYFKRISGETSLKLKLIYGGGNEWKTSDGLEILSWKSNHKS